MTDAPAVAEDGSTRWPLSYTQQFLWFLGRRWPETAMSRQFTVSLTIEVAADVDDDLVRLVVQQMVDRHEVLRSAVVEDPEAPWIRVVDEVTVELTTHHVAHPGRGDSGGSDAVDELLAACALVPVPATEAPAARFDLFRTPVRSWLNVTVHHLFFDHWSASLFRRDFARLLSLAQQHVDEAEPATPRTPQDQTPEIQYVDFAVWEQQLLATPQAQAGVDYWVQQLADLPRMEVPTDRPRPWIRTAAAGRLVITLSSQEYAAVRRLGQEHAASAFMVLATGFMALLAGLTGSDDVAVPIVFAGQRRAETAEMLGYFDNVLFLRTCFDPGATVSQTLRQTRSDFLDAYEHHEVPILAVMERQPRLLFLLGDPRNVWVLFHLQVDATSLSTRENLPPSEAQTPEPPRTSHDEDVLSEAGTYNFGADLDVTMREVDGGLQIALLYSSDLFEAHRLQSWLDGFRAGLRAATLDADLPLLPLFDVRSRTPDGPV